MVLRRIALAFLMVTATVVTVMVPAGAVHLFPLVPGDPGGDCAAALEPDPGTSAAHVGVKFFSFEDDASGGPTTEVKAGDSVTWRWDQPFCHSVTFQSGDVRGTQGGPPGGFDGSEPQLVKPEGSNNSFTATFTKPGTYDYICVHHSSMGMMGQVVVS